MKEVVVRFIAPKLTIFYRAQFIIPNNAPPKTPQPSGPAMAVGKARKILSPIARADKRAPPKTAPLVVSATSDFPFGASTAIVGIIAEKSVFVHIIGQPQFNWSS